MALIVSLPDDKCIMCARSSDFCQVLAFVSAVVFNIF